MRRALVVLVALLGACDHPSSMAAGAPASERQPASAAPTVSAAVAPSAASAPSAAASSPPSAGAAASFHGAYKAKVGVVTPPKDAKIQLWAKDEGAAFVGDGALDLTITGTTVRGEAKGALGEQTITGVLDDKDLSARVDPKNPNAEGAMTGVLTGKLEGAALSVVLRVSGRNGNIVREATFVLTRK